jgi:hypothetical protein
MVLPATLFFLLTTAPQGASPDLAPGEGRDLVLTACTGCHTTDLIVAARMTRRNWDTTLTWMEETQGLTRLEPALRKAILDYLEKTQGLSRDEEAETSSPWASPRYRPNPIW